MQRLVFLLFVGYLSGLARAETVSYVIVVGNNAPPRTEGMTSLPQLRYADDDAVRFHQFFSRFAKETHLLTVLDNETQKRYPNASAISKPPALSNLKNIVEKIADQMVHDRKQGDDPLFYFIYSGHGAINDEGRAFLAFLDGGLTHQVLYDQVVARLPSAYSHLLIDACHAGAVVGARGMFDKEVDARTVEVSPSEALKIVEFDSNKFPGLGLIIATTADQEAHEWSRLQSGIFSHELLSGLAGPADVNGDGQIEYSEIHAFVASANREIKDPRAVPKIISRPPQRNQNIPLVSLERMRGTVALTGDPSRLGHFYIELENGQRYLDANLGGLNHGLIVLPAGLSVFLRTANREVEIATDGLAALRFSDLVFTNMPTVSKGSIDAAYRSSLFASPFGVTYYKGFVDSIGAVGVRFVEAIPSIGDSLNEPPAYRKPLAIGCLTLAGGSVIASLVTGALAIKAKYDFDHTSLQRPAHDLAEKYKTYGNAALATGVVAVAAGLLTWLLWPDDGMHDNPVTVSNMPGRDNGLVFGFSW